MTSPNSISSGETNKLILELQKENNVLQTRIVSLESEIQDLRMQISSLLNTQSVSNAPESLSLEQRVVLEALSKLPSQNFAEGQNLLQPLVGLPMTEAFAKGLGSVLRVKEWGAVCESCGVPAGITWVASERYSQGGRAQFSHTAGADRNTKHGSLTSIKLLQFASRPDRRKKKK